MKKILFLIPLLLAGCTTTPTGQQVPDVATMQVVARSATYVGTRLWLEANPQDRVKFEAARLGLRALIAAGSFDAQQLTAVLSQLPVKELRGDLGTVVIDTAVVLWDQYGRQLASLDKQQVFNTYVLPVAQSILAGLDLAMGP